MDKNFEYLLEDYEKREKELIKHLNRLIKLDLKDLKEMDKNNENLDIIKSLAIKIAISKKLTKEFNEKLKSEGKKVNMYIIFAVYKENRRVLKESEDENGEDFLRRKIYQLDFLYKNTNFIPKLIIVDDGCPYNSGEIIKEIANKENYNNVEIYFIKDYLNKGVLKGLNNENKSKKGGSILLGLEKALEKSKEDDIIIYTDADLSIDLRQSTYLFEDIFNKKCDFVIGSRRERNSKTLKKGIRDYRGKIFIYFWKKILKELSKITNDTQCAFKAFNKESLKKLLKEHYDFSFTFDIELIIKAYLENLKVCKKGIVWIDSEKESNTKDSTIYLEMLKNVVFLGEKYGLIKDKEAIEHSKFITNLDKESWIKFIEKSSDLVKDSDIENLSKINLIKGFNFKSI